MIPLKPVRDIIFTRHDSIEIVALQSVEEKPLSVILIVLLKAFQVISWYFVKFTVDRTYCVQTKANYSFVWFG